MNERQRERYSRQILFAGVGEEGQQRLLGSSVAVVGCGALGTVSASAMVRAGVGKVRIIDRDYVEWSNLQRQWLFEEQDAEEGLPKAIAAARHLARVNSGVEVTPVVSDLVPGNVDDLLEGVDLILDATDNFETRYLVNDYAVMHGMPWVYGAAVGSYGLCMPVIPGQTPCLKCVYPEPPTGAQPTCETAGVLNSITATIGALQSAAAMRILCGDTAEMKCRITTVDVWEGIVRQIGTAGPDPECPACARRDFVHLRAVHRAPISLCGRNAVQIHARAGQVDLEELRERLQSHGVVRANEFALRFFLDPYEMTVFPDGRAIIKGTTDVGIARSLYARYVGA
jgi:molybdopterin-synthase adenylyltransferase